MKKRMIAIPALVLAACGAAAWLLHDSVNWFEEKEDGLVLYGNVDNRQLQLAFLIPERIAELIPEEGETVRKGELLETLETVRIENDVAAAEAAVASRKAAVDAARAAYEKARNGSRPEYVAMARNASAAVSAKLRAAEADWRRQSALLSDDAVSVQIQESAEAEYLFLKSALEVVRSALDRLTAGERAEDVAAAKAKFEQAKAELALAEAELAIRKQKLADSKLFAPSDGVIRNRLLEPGELAGPNRPVFAMTAISPKWIRVFLRESDLPKVKPGDRAIVRFDGAERDFEGWIGFISSTAEFTPKNIETPELRTTLVYEARIFVKDPENRLKLGAPATAILPGVESK